MIAKADRHPPENIDAEKRLIGGLLIAHKLNHTPPIEEVRTIVGPGSFAQPEHGRIFQAILDVVDDDGLVDPCTIKPKLEAVDPGHHWQDHLAGALSEAEPEDVVKYAKTIAKAAHIRSMIQRTDAVQETLFDPLATDEERQVAIERLSDAAHSLRHRGRRAVIRKFSEIERRKVEWLWPNRIPMGKISIIAGNPTAGKSWLTIDLAARISRGIPWPDCQGIPNPAGSVLMLGCEDGAEDTIGPRLDWAGADSEKVEHFEGIEKPGKGKLLDMFSLGHDIGLLEDGLKQRPDTRCVVIDPISAYMGGQIDTHKDADVRAVLSPLAAMAERCNVAVVLVMHFKKAPTATAIHRVGGSIGFTGQSRATWILTRDPDDENRRLLLLGKNNLAADAGGMAFRIQDAGFGDNSAVIHWEDGPVEISADEALAEQDPRARRVSDDVEAWLRATLKDGPRPEADLRDEASGERFSWATVKRVKRRLGIRSYKMPGEPRAPWAWEWNPEQITG